MPPAATTPAITTPAAAPPLMLGFLLFPGFPMACLTQAIEPLRAANEIAGRRAFAWRLLAETAAPVPSSAEVRFTPDAVLDGLADAAGAQTVAQTGGLDHLYLLAPPAAAFHHARRTPAVLRRLDRAGVTLGGFSGGIFPLARAGLMAGRRASVHWCYDMAFRAEFPQVEPCERAILREGRRITVSGAGAVFDLMLRLIGERLGAGVMTETACWFQHSVIRDEDARQKVPVARAAGTEDALSAPIRQALRLFEDHIEDPLRIPDVAAAVNMSARHFERLFKRETGQSPLRHYHLLRLQKARQKVLYSTQALSDIALSVGYPRAAEMTRHYAGLFGMTPSEDRRAAGGVRGLSAGWAEAAE